MWRDAFAGLARGRDPRSPFVEAFADEQLLGFTRYYIIILEASKKNIAGAWCCWLGRSSLAASCIAFMHIPPDVQDGAALLHETLLCFTIICPHISQLCYACSLSHRRCLL